MTDIITDNLVRKVGKDSGLRDTNEAYELVFDQSPVETRLGQEEMERRMRSVKIDEQLDEKTINPEKKILLENIRDYIKRTSVAFQDEMQRLMDDYQEGDGGVFTKEIHNKMLEKGYDLPTFSILDGESAQNFLEDMGEDFLLLNKEGLLLIFNLPRPVARMWYRGGTDSWGNMAKEIPEANIEWGHLYRESLPVIWQEQGFEEDEGYLSFDRINPVNQHDWKKYYYVWQVTSNALAKPVREYKEIPAFEVVESK